MLIGTIVVFLFLLVRRSIYRLFGINLPARQLFRFLIGSKMKLFALKRYARVTVVTTLLVIASLRLAYRF